MGDDNCTAFPPSLSLYHHPKQNKHKPTRHTYMHTDGPDGPSTSTSTTTTTSLLSLPLPLATDPRALRAALPRLREAWHLLFQELTLDTLRWGGGWCAMCVYICIHATTPCRGRRQRHRDTYIYASSLKKSHTHNNKNTPHNEQMGGPAPPGGPPPRAGAGEWGCGGGGFLWTVPRVSNEGESGDMETWIYVYMWYYAWTCLAMLI